MNWYTPPPPPPPAGPNPNEGIPILICFVLLFFVLLTGVTARRAQPGEKPGASSFNTQKGGKIGPK